MLIPLFYLNLKLLSLTAAILLFGSQAAASPLSILQSPPLSFSVKEFGATGEGHHYDTLPIQSTIEACSAAVSTSTYVNIPPCHVKFPPGKYLTATIYLKSNVILDIEKNATIFGGTKIEDYPREQDRWYVVVAEGEVGVGITGGGEINGQGLKFVKEFDERKNVMVSWNETGACLGDECRPRLVGFIGCKDVRIWNVNLIEPAYWW